MHSRGGEWFRDSLIGKRPAILKSKRPYISLESAIDPKMWSILRLVAAAVVVLVVVAVVIGVSNRLGGDPANWLLVIIPIVAAMAFYLQILKNW